MRQLSVYAFIATAIVLLSACGHNPDRTASTPTPGATSSDAAIEQELIKLDKEWSNVYRKSDPGNQTILERVLADEYIYVEHDGRITNKQQDIEFLKSLGPATESEPTNTDYRVHIYGDTAVMIHRSVDTRTRDGEEIRNHTFALHVFVKRDGRWQIVAAQRTRLPEAPTK